MPRTIRVALETWRTDRRMPSGDELQSTWTMQQAPAGVEVWESGDVVDAAPENTVTWYHRNAYSVVPHVRGHGIVPAGSPLPSPRAGHGAGRR